MQAVQTTYGTGEDLRRCCMCGRDHAAKHTVAVEFGRWGFVFCYGCCNRYGGVKDEGTNCPQAGE